MDARNVIRFTLEISILGSGYGTVLANVGKDAPVTPLEIGYQFDTAVFMRS